jgi:hypothetical protein
MATLAEYALLAPIEQTCDTGGSMDVAALATHLAMRRGVEDGGYWSILTQTRQGQP